MEKLDLKKQLAPLYNQPAGRISIVEAPAAQFLMIDGEGNPNTAQTFAKAVEALFGLSYNLKFMVKKGPAAADYSVMPLEGLWWTDDMLRFSMDDKDSWKWTLMIRQPDFITADMVREARAQLDKKKGAELPALGLIRFESMAEGTCAQILHIGPYSAEPPTIQKLHAFIRENGYELHGKHREIYLSDARRAAPEKMKTIIRQPIRKA
ncbi:MAG: GyrI-like domain-containing protein [Saprospiraceae bacterium]|nr:GyrI-like domain-containing protein [Saprospiraceae bacterium]